MLLIKLLIMLNIHLTLRFNILKDVLFDCTAMFNKTFSTGIFINIIEMLFIIFSQHSLDPTF